MEMQNLIKIKGNSVIDPCGPTTLDHNIGGFGVANEIMFSY